MTPLATRVDPRGADFAANHAANLADCQRLQQELAISREGGGERYNQRHLARGKLLPRERIERLLDPASHFLELCPLAGRDVDLIQAGAGVVGGIGLVAGVECLITASEATVQGGAVNEIGVQKSQRLSDIALENRLPGISCIESAGADLPNQANIFLPGGASSGT